MTETETTFLDFLPPLYQGELNSAKKILSLLKMLDFIIDIFIQSQSAFFQNNTPHFFDVHPQEDCCEIRVVNLLLKKTHAFKSELERYYFIDYLKNRKMHIHHKMKYFSSHPFCKSVTPIDFLKNNELIILVNLLDQYIFMTYFFFFFRKKNKIDDQKIATMAAISRKESKVIAGHYQKMLSKISQAVITHISADILDHKKSQELLALAKKEALAANRVKTEFLENMRHDIRTPLTGIIGFAQLIQSEAISQKTKDYADNLVLATTALLDFQNEILDAIKISTHAESVAREPFDLKQLAEKVIHLVRPKAIVKNLALSLTLDKQLPQVVCGDAKRLFRILLELTTNALKFTAQGKIDIYLSPTKMMNDQFTLCCEIVDTGIGIPADKKEDVFIRFHRLSSSSEGIYEGTGLGLTVVKKYIKDLGGKITIDSVVGAGSRFVCLIPLSVATLSVTQKSIPVVAPALDMTPVFQHKKILLVEDHAMTATVTQLMLAELGCEIDIASDAKTALLKSQQNSYDLIFMDLGLPDCNGFELAKKMREKALKIPVIALTAHREEENELRCIASGMNAIFQKPLLKPAAIQLLATYFSDDVMHEKIIDLSLGAKKINRGEDDAKAMIDHLINGIHKDQQAIQSALDRNDMNTLRDVNHKLLGGLLYCGVPRLTSACQQLQQALQAAMDKEKIDDCTRNVLLEIAALMGVQDAIRK